MAKNTQKKSVETLKHDEASRKNIPTAEYQSVMRQDEQSPVRVAYERRNRDLDPQLVWRGKDEQDWSDLVVHAPPLYIQEKVQPKVLIDDLLRRTQAGEKASEAQADLFADFDGLPDDDTRTEFYRHDAHWANRMILGDSLQVMASLAEREGLRGKVQCIYLDPPYGIKFNSNFQWSTTSRDVKDGNVAHITREPEQVRAFRDTWREGIHSYLTYLRDRLTVARDLLTDSGSIFVQIGDENVHRVRALMDEVFGEDNFIGLIWFRKKTMPLGATYLERMGDYVVWFSKNAKHTKFRRLFKPLDIAGDFHWNWRQTDLTTRKKYSKKELEQNPSGEPLRLVSMWPPSFSAKDVYDLPFQGKKWPPAPGQCYPSVTEKLERVAKAGRLEIEGSYLRYVMKLSDDDTTKLNLTWTDTIGARDQRYVVETNEFVVQRCILMSTDPGDLVLDPTCGSGTTAFVAEQWGRRWITIDTSRVALALARARIMGARYPFYLPADSPEGQRKEAELTRTVPSSQPTRGDIRQGFVYERVPHVTLKSIANNAEIDVIWEKFQAALEPLREQLDAALGRQWEEWQIPRDADDKWPAPAKKLHARWWQQRIARQKEIDASIASKAEFEYLYDKPYEDKKRVRVAGPFTVESLSPHRVPAVGENDELLDFPHGSHGASGEERDFVTMILENLKSAGVQQAHKEDKINFTSLTPWPGDLICAEGRYAEGGEESGREKRAAIFVGPEFGTVSRPDLVLATREAGDAGFDVLIACAFNYDAHSSEFNRLGRIPVLKARMNADLHMADDLKNTGKGNLFVIFGEPDIDIIAGDQDAKPGQIRIKLNGVDVFHPNTGEVRSDGADGIACWFIDTDYNEESFFVRQAYFLGANDPYKALKTTLKAEINEEAWETLHSDTSRPFDKPKSGRIAVKVINHLGDEVMKVFRTV
jgi:adenine-specific DNA-methyltransferase